MRIYDLSAVWELISDPTRDSGVLVSFDLSLTSALRIDGVDIACSSSGDLVRLSEQLSQMLAALPANSLARFYSFEVAPFTAELEQYTSQFPTGSFAQQLALEKAEQCRAGLAPRKRELLVTLSTPKQLDLPRYTPMVLGWRADEMQNKARDLLHKQMQALRLMTDRVSSHLRSLGMSLAVLDRSKFYESLWRLANPMRSMCFSAPALQATASLRSQLFVSGMRNHNDFFEREGHLHRVVSLKTLPDMVQPACAAVLQGRDFPHVVCVSVRRRENSKAAREIARARSGSFEIRKWLGALRGQEKNEENPDPELINQRDHTNDMLAHIAQGDAVCEIAVQVLVTAPTREALDRHTEDALESVGKLSNAEGAIEEYRSRQAYLGLLPGHHAFIGDRFHTILASRAADLLPVFAASLGAENPAYLMCTTDRTLFGWDPFDRRLSAHNATIVGRTGGGKSVGARLMQLGHIGRGGRGVVITKGTDYHRMAELLGGKAYDISLEDPNLALGPFSTPSRLQPDTASGRRRLAHLSSAIEVMATEPGDNLTRPMRLAIYRAVRSLYRRFAADEAPTFRDYVAELEGLASDKYTNAEALESVLRAVRYWIDGPYGEIFCRNRPEIDVPFTVWNIQPIEDSDQQAVVLAMLSRIVAQSIDLGPTIITLDECWALLESDAGATLVANLYRTVRKEGSCVWGITQSIGDFIELRPSVRNVCVNNSAILMFVELKAVEVELVAKTFNMNDREKERLAALKSKIGEYSDLLLFVGDNKHLVQIALAGTELWVVTSDKRDARLEAVARAAYPHHSTRKLVELLGKVAPHGAAHVRFAA